MSSRNIGTDFTPMAELYPTRISRVVHHSIVTVDEQSTEAADSTVVIMAADAAAA